MRRATLLTALLVAALLGGCASGSSTSSPSSSHTTTSPPAGPSGTSQPGTVGPEGVVLETGSALAPAANGAQGKTLNGIECGGTEQFVKHVHAHLAIYVNGQPVQVPGGVGLVQPQPVQNSGGQFFTASQCFYWLHTHAADGIIHIESPSAKRVFTLGDFFAIWQQPLSSRQVGPAKGAVTAYLNGQRWSKDPNAIPLNGHYVVQLAVGKPVAFHRISFGNQSL